MIELTHFQARALAELSERTGTIILHQLAHQNRAVAEDDVFATPHGSNMGYRIDRDGNVSQIGETLPTHP